MCYHISFEVKLESILDIFPDLVVDNQLNVDFPTAGYVNGFDHKHHPVMLTGRKDGRRHLGQMMWGFLPGNIKNMEQAERFWNGYKDENGKWQTGYITLNAMGEELFQKKLYAEAARKRRCVIFVDGLFEWQHIFPIGKKGQRLKVPKKYPHHIFLKENNLPFAMFAGIWNVWKHEEVNTSTGEIETFVTPTFAIVTTEANELMAKIHNSQKRMPTILTRELAEEWIADGLTDERVTEIATFQYPSELMEAFTIKKDFQESSTPKEKFVYPEKAEFC